MSQERAEKAWLAGCCTESIKIPSAAGRGRSSEDQCSIKHFINLGVEAEYWEASQPAWQDHVGTPVHSPPPLPGPPCVLLCVCVCVCSSESGGGGGMRNSFTHLHASVQCLTDKLNHCAMFITVMELRKEIDNNITQREFYNYALRICDSCYLYSKSIILNMYCNCLDKCKGSHCTYCNRVCTVYSVHNAKEVNPVTDRSIW